MLLKVQGSENADHANQAYKPSGIEESNNTTHREISHVYHPSHSVFSKAVL